VMKGGKKYAEARWSPRSGAGAFEKTVVPFQFVT
jgi:hypothetical protein